MGEDPLEGKSGASSRGIPSSAGHKLALIKSLPFVHTARRYYRLDGLVRSSDRPAAPRGPWRSAEKTIKLDYLEEVKVVTPDAAKVSDVSPTDAMMRQGIGSDTFPSAPSSGTRRRPGRYPEWPGNPAGTVGLKTPATGARRGFDPGF
ncbi:hypothetical protein G5714_024568 [Onychostoma macrolepis]|uniref:Uncharacterized protein n=1 Tax=Onychostoma macrolepis TaxID=369639 RepID=A0A7J6BHN6_9TELE|nr:hypothetical protein G5714_024568 [Onychostoma macrolepis]